MGHAIIQQPDGKFCIFSSISDGMILWDATEDEVMTLELQEALESRVQSVRRMIERAKGNLPQFAHYPTYEEAVADHNKRYPEDRIEPVTAPEGEPQQ